MAVGGARFTALHAEQDLARFSMSLSSPGVTPDNRFHSRDAGMAGA